MSEYATYCKCPAGDTIRLLVNAQHGEGPDYPVIHGSIAVQSTADSGFIRRKEVAQKVYPFTGNQGHATAQLIEGAIMRCPGTGSCDADHQSRCTLPITL